MPPSSFIALLADPHAAVQPPYAWYPFLPPCLTRYIAVSAHLISAAASDPSAPSLLIPMLIESG